ncbi:MAG: hypothetical protein J5850_06145 [Clostridia bacterium]|nr:hypothetical protein [Clostridia bacterium]
MQPRNIDSLVDQIEKCVEKHRLNEGSYSRWLWDNGKGRNLGQNEYGCADAANILYTIGKFPREPEKRAEWIRVLQSMQNPETGMYREPTHHTIHTTAHCTAALELFDASPLYKCKYLEKCLTKEGLYDFLENDVNWQNPWGESHKGAGILPALVNTGMVGAEWLDWYFDWMWENSDPDTGFFYYAKNGEPKKNKIHAYLAGGFHYMFNHEYERRPLRYPERIIDTCIYLIDNGIENMELGGLLHNCGFIEIDVVYTLTRAMRYTPYRFYEGKERLEFFAEKFFDFMYSLDYEHDEFFNDLHALFGSVCCMAELQTALPGKIKTTRPLKIVLDRRPFI